LAGGTVGLSSTELAMACVVTNIADGPALCAGHRRRENGVAVLPLRHSPEGLFFLLLASSGRPLAQIETRVASVSQKRAARSQKLEARSQKNAQLFAPRDVSESVPRPRLRNRHGVPRIHVALPARGHRERRRRATGAEGRRAGLRHDL